MPAYGLQHQAQQLAPHGEVRPPHFAALIQFAAGSTANLAAGGLQYAMGWRQHDIVGRHTGEVDHDAVDLLLQALPRTSFLLVAFRQYHQALGTGGRVRTAEHRDAAFAQAGQIADRRFDIVGVDVAPGTDDQVLGAAGQVDLTAGHVGEVERVEPAIAQYPAGLFGIAVVAAAGGRPAKLQMTFAALGEFEPAAIDDANLLARQRPAAGDEAQRCTGVRCARQCIAVGLERFALHPVDQRPSAQGRKGQAQRGLGQPIDGCQRGGRKPVASETFGEALQGIRADRLGTVEGHAPTAQVQALEVALREFAQAQFIGEIRRRR
ncbi:hypothetical protein PS691_05811 [Pseudomonas fluorescens]|uniref:Uncharacterized protein n=1 Tax=Pseudomonas fluorescens TaxID=294 RepID=A0A5E7FR35_PSEFL|nr:hypothetical protein PS691_05811 [Pseudomonas fluorescens]